MRRRSRGWREVSAEDGAADTSVRRHCKGGSTEALPAAGLGRDRFGIAESIMCLGRAKKLQL